MRFNEQTDVQEAPAPVSASPTKKQNFLLSAGAGEESSWNVNCLPQYEEKEIVPDPALQDKKYLAKESCWNCYKLFVSAEGFRDENIKRV